MAKKKKDVSDVAQARKASNKKDWQKNKMVYLLFIPIAVYLLIFNYIPMTGILMAFEDYSIKKGWFHSTWVGMENFAKLFSGSAFPTALRNTFCMAFLNLILGFLPPVLLALLFSECKWIPFRRVAQLVSYVPSFISAVVVCNLLQQFVGKDGPITLLLSAAFGLENKNWLADANIPVFWIIYALMNVWVGMGWGSIVYTTSISNVNGELKEAAALDGANRLQRIQYIVLPELLPLVMMQLTLSVGTMFMAGWDKVLILYMPTTFNVSDVLYTYTYRMAFGSQVDYGLSTASGLFQSILGTVFLLVSNKLNKTVTGYALY